MVDEEQGPRYAGFYLWVEQNFQALEEVHVVKSIGDITVVGLDRVKEGVDHLDSYINSLRIIDIGLLQ